MKPFIALLAMSFASSTAFAATSWGPVKIVGHGTARTFLEMGDKGQPDRVGFFLSETALEGLPEKDAETVLPMPNVPGFSTFQNGVLNWNAHGHDPKEIYGVPHFDFHFYMIGERERMAIRCTADDAACMQKPDSRLLPPQYGPTPEGVPMMGWHWVDVTSPEFHGKPFTSTFIYGYYAGKPIFIEPMVTREFLLSRTRFEAPIRQPEAFERSGNYPRAYSVEYDAGARGYRISMRWH